VSEVEVEGTATVPSAAAQPYRLVAEKSPHAKCERCWNLRASVGRSVAHPTLCGRCVSVLDPAGVP
jgi:isoleucyl-tRNA synthetase